jgi:hypothetical protein
MLSQFKTILSLTIATGSLYVQPAAANSQNLVPAPLTPVQAELRSGGPTSTASVIQVDSWYAAGRDIRLGDGTQVPADTEFTVLQIRDDQVQIGIDNDLSTDPLSVWIPMSQLERANPRLVDTEAVELFADLGIDLMTTFVARRRGGRRGGGGMTYCLRDVRIRAAKYTRCVPQNIPMASIAYPRYKAAGWDPITYSPSVPNGTACFFEGGRPCGRGSYCGHAAIKVGPNRWVGAGTTPTPFLRDRRDSGRVPYKYHGCLTPPKSCGGR